MNLNVFASLAKYNSATDENYLTESLVFLVRLFLDTIPNAGLNFINLLCCQNNLGFFDDVSSIKISTQISTDTGTPDIEIRTRNSIVFIEVKHDSPLGLKQLERYKDQLEKIEVENKKLILLTRSRYSYIETTLLNSDYSRIYWYEIYRWLANQEIKDPVCKYFGESFMNFLEEKQMSLKKITPDYEFGIPALLNLTEMLRTAIVELIPGEKIINTGGWNWRGFYLPGDYWFGIRFSENMLVTFEDNRGYEPVTYKRILNLKDKEFLSLDNNEQFDVLVEFLKESLEGTEI